MCKRIKNRPSTIQAGSQYVRFISRAEFKMRCSILTIAIVLPFVGYILHLGFGPTLENIQTAAIDTSVFDDLDPIDAAERLLELIAVPTVTQRAPLSNVSASLMLRLHERMFLLSCRSQGMRVADA